MTTNPIADKLRSLPQFPRIRREDAQRWVTYVANTRKDQLLWLIDRLGAGFGGSEIGTLILDAQGRSGPFTSATELVNEKLMRVLPTPAYHYMRKGIALEDAVIAATLRLYGGESDQNTLDAFNIRYPNEPFGVTGNLDFPWIRRDGIRTLADVKVPGSGMESLSDNDKTFTYCAQLNTYNLLANAKGLSPFDQLLNLHLELPPVVTDAMMYRLRKYGEEAFQSVVDEMVTLLKYNRPGMRLHMVEQPINPEIEFNGQNRLLNDIICEVAALNWQAVLDGNVPNASRQAHEGLSPEQRQKLATLEKELLNLQALNQSTLTRIEDCQVQIKSLCRNIRTEGLLSQTPHVNIKTAISIDNEAAEHLCQRYGVNTDQLCAERKKLGVRDYDTLAMAERLRELDEDMTPFIRPAPLDEAKLINILETHGENPDRVLRYETKISASRKQQTSQLIDKLSVKYQSLVDSVTETQGMEAQDRTQTEEHTVLLTSHAR